MTDQVQATDVHAKVKEKLATGKMKYKDLVKLVSPGEVPVTAGSSDTPALLTLTEAQTAALEKIKQVFGAVQPTTRRSLTSQEIATLAQERAVIDTILSMAGDRKEGIRDTVHVHFDTRAEAAGLVDDSTPRHEERGFYLLPGEEDPDPVTGKAFSRSVRGGAPTLDPKALEALADDPDSSMTRKDYLAMTRQVRVFDEAKFMLHLRANPDLVPVVAGAISPGKTTAAINFK